MDEGQCAAGMSRDKASKTSGLWAHVGPDGPIHWSRVLCGGPLCPVGGSPVWGVPCVVQALGAIFDSVLIKCHSKRPCQIFTSMFPAQPDGTRYSISVTGQLKTHTNQSHPPAGLSGS